MIETKAGNHYSAKKVEDTIIALTEAIAERGYAFVQVQPRAATAISIRTPLMSPI
ncbi:MAG: POTRA domain-containing protein [Nitratireductor sp.]